MLYVIGDALGVMVLLAALAVLVVRVQNRARAIIHNRERGKTQGKGCDKAAVTCCTACTHCSQAFRPTVDAG